MSAESPGKYSQLQDTFGGLSTRERLLILITGVVAIGLLGTLWFIEPAYLKIDNGNKEVRRLTAQAKALDIQISAIKADLEQDPNKTLNDRIALNRRDIRKLDEQLEEQTNELVPPSRMASLLEKVLAKSDKLTLREMRSIPPIQMLQLEEEDTAQTNLYQHGVMLTMQGSYFDIQQYLESIESLQWQFYWKKFSYRVTDYPLAEVDIELYTLSTSPAFIGVWDDD